MKITAKQASQKYNISRATIESWVKKGILSRIIGRPHLYETKDLEKTINNRKKCTICGQSLSGITGRNKHALCNDCKNKCCLCNKVLIDKNRYKNTRYCVMCKKEYERKNSARRRQNNPEYMQSAIYRSKMKNKLSVFSYYSNGSMQCVKCNYSDIRALSIDHIEGDGCKHKNKKGERMKGDEIYRWIKRNNFPPGFQILCMNCQFIKRYENNENN